MNEVSLLIQSSEKGLYLLKFFFLITKCLFFNRNNTEFGIVLKSFFPTKTGQFRFEFGESVNPFSALDFVEPTRRGTKPDIRLRLRPSTSSKRSFDAGEDLLKSCFFFANAWEED